MANVVVTETGPLYSLSEVKEHLRVDHSDDDGIIQAYMDAAEQAVLQYCNLSLVPIGKEPTFKVAALMAVSDFYDRGLIGDALPRAAVSLINPYRWLRV